MDTTDLITTDLATLRGTDLRAWPANPFVDVARPHPDLYAPEIDLRSSYVFDGKDDLDGRVVHYHARRFLVLAHRGHDVLEITPVAGDEHYPAGYRYFVHASEVRVEDWLVTEHYDPAGHEHPDGVDPDCRACDVEYDHCEHYACGAPVPRGDWFCSAYCQAAAR
jgi:hypothetical protein